MRSIETNQNFIVNNFDLIRLFAALQVAHFHIIHIMNVATPQWYTEIIRALGLFPGVPIFFFISGFLISKSWEKNPSIKVYSLNRILRIYPALIVAVSLSFLLIHISGYVEQVGPTISQLVTLFIAKATILQFYNPEFMRGYGDGVMNGSLWTISVELQFYLLTPFLYLVLFKRGKSDRIVVGLILALLIISVIFHSYREVLQDALWYKLIRVSFIPWVYMFLVGVFFQKNFDFLYRILRGRFLFCFVIYVVIALIARYYGADFGNSVNPLVFLCLAAVVFSAAYSNAGLSRKTLAGADISYGVYIYHMPIVNFLIYTGREPDAVSAFSAMLLTIVSGVASWFLIEKRFLKLKPRTIKPKE